MFRSSKDTFKTICSKKTYQRGKQLMSNLPKCQHEDKADGWVNRKMCKIKKKRKRKKGQYEQGGDILRCTSCLGILVLRGHTKA